MTCESRTKPTKIHKGDPLLIAILGLTENTPSLLTSPSRIVAGPVDRHHCDVSPRLVTAEVWEMTWWSQLKVADQPLLQLTYDDLHGYDIPLASGTSWTCNRKAAFCWKIMAARRGYWCVRLPDSTQQLGIVVETTSYTETMSERNQIIQRIYLEQWIGPWVWIGPLRTGSYQPLVRFTTDYSNHQSFIFSVIFNTPRKRNIENSEGNPPFCHPPIHVCLELIGVSANWVSLLHKSSERVGLIKKSCLTPNWPHSSPLRVFYIINPPKILHGPLKLSFSIPT